MHELAGSRSGKTGGSSVLAYRVDGYSRDKNQSCYVQPVSFRWTDYLAYWSGFPRILSSPELSIYTHNWCVPDQARLGLLSDSIFFKSKINLSSVRETRLFAASLGLFSWSRCRVFLLWCKRRHCWRLERCWRYETNRFASVASSFTQWNFTVFEVGAPGHSIDTPVNQWLLPVLQVS